MTSMWSPYEEGDRPATALQVASDLKTVAYEFVEGNLSWRESNLFGVLLVSQAGREIGGWVYANLSTNDVTSHWVGLYDEACIVRDSMAARNPQGIYEVVAYGCPSAQDRLMSDDGF